MCPCVPGRIGSNLEVLVFEERGKLENPEKNLSEQRREPTTKGDGLLTTNQELNPHMASTPGFEPGPHGRRVLSPLRHLCPRQTLSWLRWKPKWAIKGHSIVPVFRPKRKTIPFGAAHTYTVYHIGEYIPLGTLAGCPYRHLLTGLGWNVSCIPTSE